MTKENIPEESIGTDLLEKQKNPAQVGNPVFDKNTEAAIVGAEVSIFKELEQEEQTGEYFRKAALKVTFERASEQLRWTEKMGGIKLYSQEEGVAVRIGPMSAAGKLLTVITENGLEWDGLIKSLPNLITGKKVKVKTVNWEVAGNTGTKTEVVDITP